MLQARAVTGDVAAVPTGAVATTEDGLLLGGVTILTGQVVDVLLRGEQVIAVNPPDRGPTTAERLDLSGYLLLPAPAEPHAHLDKAFTAARIANPTGDLDGAVQAWLQHSASMGHDDVVERATAALCALLANGATAVRSHVDVAGPVGLRPLVALAEVREVLRGRVTLQLAAFAHVPLTGSAGATNRALLRDALELGADVVGSCPPRDPDPAGCLETCLELAAAYRRPVDLHLDETLDPAVLQLPDLADRVAETGFPYGATASHCVSLGVQPPQVAARVAARVAAAGVAVVCNPQSNLFLQARGQRCAPARGLTALRPLLDAGVLVAGGGDNLRDPFNPVGRADPLATAWLLVLAGHLTLEEAYAAVSAGARAAMGLPEVQVAAGFPAELLAVRASSLGEAIADGTNRIAIHQGRVVSRTTVTREFAEDRSPT